jgi:transposase InsO family protein
MNLLFTLIQMRSNIIQQVLQKEMSVDYASKILWVTRKTVHKRWCRYQYEWESAFLPKKSGPKKWTPRNKIDEETENLISELALLHKSEWPIRLSLRLFDEHWITIEQSTVYRILKRRNIRYYLRYEKPKKIPKLYTHEVSWYELQVDTSFPFWRHRKIVIYTAIDDATRSIYTRAYEWYWIEQSQDFAIRVSQQFWVHIQTVRTDQWREFGTWFTKKLEELWIKHHKNDPYHPEQNWKVERYHRTLREEEEFKRPYLAEVDEINYYLRQRMKHYNTKRKHTWLWMNGLTPVQKRKKTTGNSLGDHVYLNTSTLY